MISHELSEKLSKINVDSHIYKLVRDKNGYPNLLIDLGASQFYLHDAGDVWQGAQEFAEKNYTDASNIILFGAGFGYHILAYLKKLQPGQKLHIFEPDLAILKIALKETDIEEVLRHESICFYADDIKNLLNPIFRCLNLRPVVFCLYAPSLNAAPKAALSIIQAIKIFKTQHFFTPKECSAADVMRNFEFNMELYPKPAKPYRIIMIGFHNNESTIRSFSDNLMLALTLLGCEISYISYKEFTESLAAVERHPVHAELDASDFIICVNTCGLNDHICDKTGIPYICILVDRPLYFISCLTSGIRNVIYTWIDKADMLVAEKYYCKSARHAFLPHGGEINFELSDVFTRERYIDVLVSGSYHYEGADPIDNLRQKDLPISRETINNIIALYEAGGKPWEECAREAAAFRTDEEVLEFMSAAGYELDRHMRIRKRTAIIKALLDGGITVHCFGANWERSELINHPNFLYHGFVLCEPGRELFMHTKILVNDLSVFITGSHERVFSSMLRGVLCITDYTDYLGEHFTDGKDIVFFDDNDLEGLVQKVKYYLANDEKRLQITKAAFEKARKKHTWLNRAADLIEIFESAH
ncbi:MAG: glycosyltransferase [Acidobacteriota bacterium]|nr:glycosyltransferase [Acidobacteriota bacterium]